MMITSIKSYVQTQCNCINCNAKFRVVIETQVTLMGDTILAFKRPHELRCLDCNSLYLRWDTKTSKLIKEEL